MTTESVVLEVNWKVDIQDKVGRFQKEEGQLKSSLCKNFEGANAVKVQ